MAQGCIGARETDMHETEPNVPAIFMVRRAIPSDLEALVALIEAFARGYPAEHHPRWLAVIQEAYLGSTSRARIYRRRQTMSACASLPMGAAPETWHSHHDAPDREGISRGTDQDHRV